MRSKNLTVYWPPPPSPPDDCDKNDKLSGKMHAKLLLILFEDGWLRVVVGSAEWKWGWDTRDSAVQAFWLKDFEPRLGQNWTGRRIF